jgi:hypothetical protein
MALFLPKRSPAAAGRAVARHACSISSDFCHDIGINRPATRMDVFISRLGELREASQASHVAIVPGQGSVQIVRGTDQGEMGECLGEISKMFAGGAKLLGE